MSFTVLFLRDLGVEKVSKARFFQNTIYLFFVLLGLHCCSGFPFPIVVSRGRSPAAVPGLRIVVASLVAERRTSSTRASVAAVPGSRAQAKWSWCSGLLVPRHVGLSQTRDQTGVSCAGRWILYTEPAGKPQRWVFKHADLLHSFIHSFIHSLKKHLLSTFALITHSFNLHLYPTPVSKISSKPGCGILTWNSAIRFCSPLYNSFFYLQKASKRDNRLSLCPDLI